MKIYIGADHRGFNLKEKIIQILKSLGYQTEDLGTNTDKVSCEYPKIAYQLASRVAQSKQDRGILVCMSGLGQVIAANKVRGAYAALCCTPEAARLSRQHNNANILVLGSKFVKFGDIRQIIKIWLESKFEGGRHQRRVNQIKKIEKGLKL